MSSRRHEFVKNNLREIALMFFGNGITDTVDSDEMAGIMLTLASLSQYPSG